MGRHLNNKSNSNNVKIILKGMIDKDINSISELADLLYYSRATVIRWLNGQTGVTEENLCKIEKLLDVKLNRDDILRDIYGKYYLTKE